MRWRFLGLGLFFLSIAVGCKPRVDAECRRSKGIPPLLSCIDRNQALMCGDPHVPGTGNRTIALPCTGPSGCVVRNDTKAVECDDNVAAEGAPCLWGRDFNSDRDYETNLACTADKKTALLCVSGKFAVLQRCRGPGGCSLDRRLSLGTPTPSDILACDARVQDVGDPCKAADGDTAQNDLLLSEDACSADAKTLLRCQDDGKMALFTHCRGPAACKVEERGARCDQSIAMIGDPCAEEGALACREDGKGELACRDHKFVLARECKGGCRTTPDGKHSCQ